jgi:hypothetical protein
MLSLYQNAGQNHDIMVPNRPFENVAQFKYLETTVTNQNFDLGLFYGSLLILLQKTLG